MGEDIESIQRIYNLQRNNTGSWYKKIKLKHNREIDKSLQPNFLERKIADKQEMIINFISNQRNKIKTTMRY